MRPQSLLSVLGLLAIVACQSSGAHVPKGANGGAQVAIVRPDPVGRLRCPGESEVSEAGTESESEMEFGALTGPVDPNIDPAGGACPPEFNGAMCAELETPLRQNDACFVANVNIRRAAKDVRRGAATASAPSPPTDARVLEHLDLTPREAERLQRLGFVVLDRLKPGGYAQAYHSIFQNQLPVYVSIDSILHAIFIANDSLTAEYEIKELWPRLVHAVDALRRGVGRHVVGQRYGAKVEADVDIYLRSAWALLTGSQLKTTEESDIFGRVATSDANRAAALLLVEKAKAAEGIERVRLFERERLVDFSQFTPRGHYGAAMGPVGQVDLAPAHPSRGSSNSSESYDSSRQVSGSLADYFRGATWLSRIELNLISRSSRSSEPGGVPNPAETPHEARVALALADLIRETGQGERLAVVQRAWDRLAGPREDVPLSELAALAREAHIASTDVDPVPRLTARVGSDYRRTVRTHPTPEGTTQLPVISTLLGPRIVRDAQGATTLVHDDIPNRSMLSAADYGYLLGNDHAKTYLAADLRQFPTLGAHLDAARAIMGVVTGTRGSTREPSRDVYDAWLSAIRALSVQPPSSATLPSFMKTPAFSDVRLNSTIVAYGQLRHNFVLMAAQPYDTYGCEIPDGYVEPNVDVYDALLQYVDKFAESVRPTAAERRKEHERYFTRVRNALSTLRVIAKHELEGMPLTEPERRYLAMVAEHIPLNGYHGDSGGPPSFTGWYFDFFPEREHDTKAGGDFVADIYTSVAIKSSLYLGAGTPRMALFRIDTGGVSRLAVGPIATGYELVGELKRRLTDMNAKDEASTDELEITKGHRAAPWATSYTVPAAPEPDLAIETRDCGKGLFLVRARAAVAIASAQIRLLDHHGDTVVAQEAALSVGATDLRFAIPEDKNGFTGGSFVEGVAIRTGDARLEAGGTVYPSESPVSPSMASYQPTSRFSFGRLRKRPVPH